MEDERTAQLQQEADGIVRRADEELVRLEHEKDRIEEEQEKLIKEKKRLEDVALYGESKVALRERKDAWLKSDTERRQRHYNAMLEATRNRRARDARLGLSSTDPVRLSKEEKQLIRRHITETGLPPIWEVSGDEFSEDEIEKMKAVEKKEKKKEAALRKAQESQFT
ncbi:MAG: hypothetical protein GY820_34625, partial [Gammaproteobacteria bacterium]|nr:hypothetical protein [Gammaproteobacteria bacterium]